MDSKIYDKGFYFPCLLSEVPPGYSFRFSPFDVSPQFFHYERAFSLDEHFVTCLSYGSSFSPDCLRYDVSSLTCVYVYCFALSDYRSFRQSVFDRCLS